MCVDPDHKETVRSLSTFHFNIGSFHIHSFIQNTNRLYGPRREKTCLRGFVNNKGAYQPANPRRLISTFVICFLESIISKLATSEI